MKLLNLACGSVRPQGEEWTNVDTLHSVLPMGSPERRNLDLETNYRNWDVISDGLPFGLDVFDGILCSHFIEHLDCQQAVDVMIACIKALKPGGILMVSVPDASYFRKVHDEDTVENAERLFGEPIHLPDGETDFLGYGLFNRFHKAVLTEDALWCYFVRAGFEKIMVVNKKWITASHEIWPSPTPTPMEVMSEILNRIPFSLIMTGHKP